MTLSWSLDKVGPMCIPTKAVKPTRTTPPRFVPHGFNEKGQPTSLTFIGRGGNTGTRKGLSGRNRLAFETSTPLDSTGKGRPGYYREVGAIFQKDLTRLRHGA